MDTLVLDATTKSVTVELDGTATPNSVTWISSYADNNGSSFNEGSSNGVIDNATPVTIVPAPASSTRRIIKSISVQNADSTARTIIVKYVASGGSTTIIGKALLYSGDRWTLDGTYSSGGGLKTWQGFDSGVTSGSPNTWSGLQTFDVGISASGEITFNGNVSGSTADFSGLVTFGARISVTGGATFNGSVESDTGYRVGAGAINGQTGGYTLVAGDNGKIITIDSASPITVTAGTDVGIAGFSCTIIRLGVGEVTIAGSGVTMNSYGGFKIAGQNGVVTVLCYATNTFNVAGQTTP